MTRKRRGLSMTSILVLALVGTITAIVLGAMAVFLQTYQRSLIRSVQTSARPVSYTHLDVYKRQGDR